MSRRAPRLGWLALAGLVAGAAACVSERVTAVDVTGACDVPLPPEVAGSTVVVIRAFTFQPATVTVTQGQSVLWINCSEPGDPAHTATGDNGSWGSTEFAARGSYSWTFTQAGTFAYHCEPHPFMVGQIVVRP